MESAWLEGVWLGRDSTTDQPVRSRALKRSVERRRWDTTLLNAMVWDPLKPTPVTRGRPLKVRSDREPILMGPIPRVQCNPSAAWPQQDLGPKLGVSTLFCPEQRIPCPRRARHSRQPPRHPRGPATQRRQPIFFTNEKKRMKTSEEHRRQIKKRKYKDKKRNIQSEEQKNF